MKKQWGSCSPKGRLSLNPMLVKAPRQCIDYVVVHELCHMKHHNHSDEYYALLTRRLPDWQERKQRLDDLAERILS
ncbi:MAG: M48 family metallopeptidase, partial [Proteobacteria bacterium]|nr:M48 family metallopeptidase [Pseudomonadota bacterium]